MNFLLKQQARFKTRIQQKIEKKSWLLYDKMLLGCTGQSEDLIIEYITREQTETNSYLKGNKFV